MMPRPILGAAVGAGLVTALAAGLALYGTGAGGGNGAAPCAGSAAAAARVDAAARGEVAAMQALPALYGARARVGVVGLGAGTLACYARPAPEIAFTGPDGAGMRLSDLRGRLVLMNLWATWCAPCRAEMPALDRLEGALGDKDFAVVAINVDTRNLDKPPAWLRDNGIARLARYADPGGRVLPAVQRDTASPGLPTTMLIDSAGCTLGVMKGPAEWSSPDGLGLIRAALGRAS